MAAGPAHRALAAFHLERPGQFDHPGEPGRPDRQCDDGRPPGLPLASRPPAVGSALEQVLREAVNGAAIGWSRCRWLGHGAGGVLVAPADAETRIVDPLVGHLAAGLRRHNRRSSPPARIRLRIAAHAGPVCDDPDGVTGVAIVQLARLLAAPALRKHLAMTSAELAMLVSDSLYDQLLRHDHGLLDPAAFQPVDLRGAESSTLAWLLASASPLPAAAGLELRSYRGHGRRLWYEQADSP